MKNKELKILLSAPRGFCAGVERAIEIVEKSIQKYGSPVYVRHEIVHNKFVVDDLRNKGAIFVEELEEIEDKTRPVIFSAHGVPKKIPQDAKNYNMTYVDATCPLVSKVHREAENLHKAGYHLILIGHENHPEVIGTMGQIKSKIYLIEKAEDVSKLPFKNNQKIAYVTQTTLSIDDTKDIIAKIKKNFTNVKEPKKNDICYATTNRQEAVKAIAGKCDYFFVIGSNNSSNSLRLVEVAKNYGAKNCKLIENVNDLDNGILKNIKTIGITASASAPEILIKNLLRRISKIYQINIIESDFEKENIHFKIPSILKEAS